MAIAFADRVKESSTSTGTGNFTLAGAVTGFRTFNSAIGVGPYFYYAIVSSSGTEWEVGLGVLGNSTTLVRPTNPFANSANTIGKLNFSAGTKNVFLTLPATAANAVVLGNVSGTPESYTSYTAIGSNTSVGGTGATVMGASAAASADNATGIGISAAASGSGATAVGSSAAASGSDALAVGVSSTASAFASVAVGRTSSASNTGATAVGPGANAGGFQSVAVGNDSNISGSGSVGLGYGASTLYTNAVALGYASVAYASSPTISGMIVIGASSNTYGGITIGSGSTGSFSSGADAIIIGHNITAVANDATYMNKFRTGVTPVGTSWFLKWDDSTKEVYADPGPGPSTPNWYAYQDAGFGTTLSVALPAATPTSYTSGTNNWLQWSNPFTPSNWASFGSYSFGGTLYVHYGSSYPLPDPTAGSTGYGFAVSYYAGYPSDSGTTSTYEVYTGSSVWSNFGSSVNLPGFSLFGGPPSRVGHAIILLSGNYSTPVPDTGVTVLETAYDSYNNVTYVFVDIDAPKVSAIGSGSAPNILTSFGGTTSYNVLFWYNYA